MVSSSIFIIISTVSVSIFDGWWFCGLWFFWYGVKLNDLFLSFMMVVFCQWGAGVCGFVGLLCLYAIL